MRRRWPGKYEGNHNVWETRSVVVNTVFPALRKKGLLARANFSCCGSCAGYDLATQATKKNAKGWVFWHHQSEDGIKDCGEVYLYFTGSDGCSKPPKNALDTLSIGRMVVEELTRNNIKYEWDGTDNTAILVLLKEGIHPPDLKEAMESVIGL